MNDKERYERIIRYYDSTMTKDEREQLIALIKLLDARKDKEKC